MLILHQGRVLLQGGVDELRTRRQDRYRLQIQGDAAAFLEELRLEGVRVLQDNGRGELRVAVPPGWATRAFFALADNHGVLLRGLQPDDEDLEELFHRVLADDGPGDRSAVMGDIAGRAGPPELLHYRPWKGTFRAAGRRRLADRPHRPGA